MANTETYILERWQIPCTCHCTWPKAAVCKAQKAVEAEQHGTILPHLEDAKQLLALCEKIRQQC